MEHPYRQVVQAPAPYPTEEFQRSGSDSPIFPSSSEQRKNENEISNQSHSAKADFKFSSKPSPNPHSQRSTNFANPPIHTNEKAATNSDQIYGSNYGAGSGIGTGSDPTIPGETAHPNTNSTSQDSHNTIYHTAYPLSNNNSANNQPNFNIYSPNPDQDHNLPSPPSNPLSTTSSFVNINQIQNNSLNQFSRSETNLSLNLSAPQNHFNHNRSVSSTSSFFDRSDNASLIDFGHNVLQQYLGSNANNLLPRMKTIELYRKNAKKSNDPTVLFQYAQYMLQTALMMNENGDQQSVSNSLSNSNSITNINSVVNSKNNSPLKNPVDTPNSQIDSINLNNSQALSMPIFKQPPGKNHKHARSFNSLDFGSTTSLPLNQLSGNSNYDETKLKKELLKEAIHYLRKLSDKGYVDAQYLLGDAYSSGALGKVDNREAFSLFQTAAKHGHIESAYRTSHSYEEGLGTNRDARKAVEYLKFAASKNHAAAMYKLGVYSFYSRMGLSNNITTKKMGIKWLTRASTVATELICGAPYELGKIYFNGFEDIVIPDKKYALELYSQSAALGHIPSAALLGHYYEVGEIVPQDSNLSIHYYTQAAVGGEPESMLAMCAWYLVGNEPYLPKDESEAFEWAKRAAVNELPKAQFALGHFYEKGIGCIKNVQEAQNWYIKAAENGDEKALLRITDKEKSNQVTKKIKKINKKKSGNLIASVSSGAVSDDTKRSDKDKDCIIV